MKIRTQFLYILFFFLLSCHRECYWQFKTESNEKIDEFDIFYTKGIKSAGENSTLNIGYKKTLLININKQCLEKSLIFGDSLETAIFEGEIEGYSIFGSPNLDQYLNDKTTLYFTFRDTCEGSLVRIEIVPQKKCKIKRKLIG